MAKCPFCSNKIESLIVRGSVEMRDNYSYNREDDTLLVERVFDTSTEILKFRCPRCAEAIFYNPAKAEEFLRNGEVS